jgi:hypothetical protein
MTVRTRLTSVGLLAILTSLAPAATAHAGLVVASASNCPSTSLSQAFLRWGDVSEYTLAPGGKFASGSPAWALSGGAKVVAGGDGYTLGGSATTQSLSLPTGSAATSPEICVGIKNPTARLMVRNTGAGSSTLAVSVEYETSLGGLMTTQIGTIAAGAAWQPSAQQVIAVNLLALLPNAQTPIWLKFAPAGSGGAWQIDDVFIDPMGRD